MSTVFEASYAELKKLKAENARLRAALQKIIDWDQAETEATRIARAALK